jgi:iron complex outermembrane receptor protein
MKLSSKAALLVGIAFLVTEARAQESMTTNGAAAPAVSDTQHGLKDIVVTARRRSEGLLETPVAVTAFSTQELERRSIQLISEIQKSTPSLIYESMGGNASEARVFIRGVGNSIANVSAEQGVGIYTMACISLVRRALCSTI